KRKIPSVTPRFRRKDRKVFIVSAPGRVYVRLRPGVKRRTAGGLEDPPAVAGAPGARRARRPGQAAKERANSCGWGGSRVGLAPFSNLYSIQGLTTASLKTSPLCEKSWAVMQLCSA